MNTIATPIASPKFLGDALEMTAEEWLDTNSCHLRERFRNLLDSCVKLGLDMPHETDYLPFCLDHYETQCGLQKWCKEAL